MIFYAFLALMALGLVVLLIRSPVVKQLRRKRGLSSARLGENWDHHGMMPEGGGEYLRTKRNLDRENLRRRGLD
jgi:hypothetical protein